MFGIGKVLASSGLDHKLLYLVETRVSQINGCGYCIDMHTKDARLEGETEQRPVPAECMARGHRSTLRRSVRRWRGPRR
jgi:AhpD family alkylhydroperoxidase